MKTHGKRQIKLFEQSWLTSLMFLSEITAARNYETITYGIVLCCLTVILKQNHVFVC